jgi:HAD superfamily hydrolase (TIGR01509 family)
VEDSLSKFDAVLFDCDGVLVDSEAISAAVMRDFLDERGWPMTQAECLALFWGKALKDLAPLIAERTGQPVTDAWMAHYRRVRDAQLAVQVRAIAGIREALEALQPHFGARIACGSGADRAKIELQLKVTGLAPFFEGRVFSGHEVPRNKPWPDVYLAAARGLGVDPARCAVIEDSPTGVAAGVAAGATVFGFAQHAAGDTLVDAGASAVFNAMAALPGLLQNA